MGVTHPILDCVWRGTWFDRLTSGESSGEACYSPPQPCVSESCIGCFCLVAWTSGRSLPATTMTGGVSGVGTRQAVGVRICVTHPTLPYGTSHAHRSVYNRDGPLAMVPFCFPLPSSSLITELKTFDHLIIPSLQTSVVYITSSHLNKIR